MHASYCYFSTLVDIHKGKSPQWCQQKLTFGIRGLKETEITFAMLPSRLVSSVVRKSNCVQNYVSDIVLSLYTMFDVAWITQNRHTVSFMELEVHMKGRHCVNYKTRKVELQLSAD